MYLKVGELAKLTGKTVRALRFYEELGLLRPIERTKGGFRLFQNGDAYRVRLIDKFHELGFSLEEIAEIVEAYRSSANGDQASKKLKPMLEKSLEALNKKIAVLEEFKREIEVSLTFVHDCCACEQHPETSSCFGCQRGNHSGTVPHFIDHLI